VTPAQEQRQVTVGIAQWLPLLSDPDDSLAQVAECTRELAASGAELVVLPELWPCAHDPAVPDSVPAEVRRHAEPLDGPRTKALARIASEHRVWFAAGTVPEAVDEAIFNTGLLFSPDGVLRAVYRKTHLYRPMHEDLAFQPGDHLTVCDTSVLGRVGLLVCFDGDFPEVARALRGAGARVVIQVNAYETKAESWWDRIYPAHALINGQWWIMANQCGTRGETTFLGGSRVISPFGDVVAQAPKARLGETPEPALFVHTMDLDGALGRSDEEAGVLVTDARPELAVEVSDGSATTFAGGVVT
jgi:predicted amidohydrolase